MRRAALPPVASDEVRKAWSYLSDGTVVETDALNIARRVNEYDPNLSVQYLTDAQRVDEPPFRIVERCKDGVTRTVFSVWILDETVLQRIYAADMEKWDVLGRIDANNAQAKSQETKRYRASMDNALEITKTIARSPKDTYTVPENVLREGTSQGSGASTGRKVKFRA